MLYKVVKSSWKYFVADLIIWFAAHNLPLLIGIYMKNYFDAENPFTITIWIVLLIISRVLFIAIGARVDIRAQQKWSQFFYTQAYDVMQRKSLKGDNGELLNALNEDVSEIVSTVSYLIDTLCNVIYGILAVCILLSLHVKLTLLILILPLAAILMNSFIKKKTAAYSEKMKKTSNRFSNHLNYMLQAGRLIRVNHMEDHVREKVRETVEQQKNTGIRFSSWLGIFNGLTNMITECNILVILFVYMQSGDLTTGSVILFITYSFDLAAMSQYVSGLILSLQNTKVYLKNFEEKFDAANETPAIKKDFPDILEKIQKGKVHILIGANASGKSMCLRYLYEHMENSVLLPENYHIFDTTIEENISLGKNVEDIEKIAELACIDMDLNDRGDKNFSGGQEFRIVLARSICHAGDCLLIDNNLTSVDEKMRKTLIENLKSLHKTIVFTDQTDREIYKDLRHIML